MKIVIAGSDAGYLVNLRGPLVRALVRRGHEVIACVPAASEEQAAGIRSLGATMVTVPLAPTALNPVRDLRTLHALVDTFRRLRPDAIFAYTIKPVIYGLIAATIARVPRRYAMLTGLGYLFTDRGAPATVRDRTLRGAGSLLYRIALGQAQRVFFQNPDDLQLFVDRNLVRAERAVRVQGSGVDLQRFPSAPMPDGTPSFTLVARLLADKGVREFAEAARILVNEGHDARFRLVGAADPNPGAIQEEEVRRWVDEGVLEWHGRVGNVQPILRETSVFVLPSYREGTPRSSLEAMATGRPIVTTDVPGCRETVDHGRNGFLVPVRDPVALAGAMRRFLDDPSLAVQMGQASRLMAETRYDVELVNAALVEEMGL